MALMITHVDPVKLQEALSYKKGTPMSSLIGAHKEDAFLTPKVYRFAPGIYLSFSDRMQRTAELYPDGPSLTSVLVAPDDSAVGRLSSKFNIEGDRGELLDPPAALLPKGAAPTYGAILKGLQIEGGRGCIESAVYRIASDGLFVHRTIQSPLYDYFFRGREDDDNEPPYAIRFKYERP